MSAAPGGYPVVMRDGVRRLAGIPLRFLQAWLAGRALRRRAVGVDTIAGFVTLTHDFESHGLGIPALQHRVEVEPLLELLAADAPRALLEIGTAGGGSLFLWSRVAADDAVVVSVDLPWGRWGSGYPLTRAPLYRAFARARQRVVLIRGDSHAVAARERVERALAGRPLDFLFIDGDHTYEGARLDYETYAPLVRPGGIIALHDIANRSEDVGVHRLWAELRASHPEAQDLLSPPPAAKGIGVVRAGGEARGAPAGTL